MPPRSFRTDHPLVVPSSLESVADRIKPLRAAPGAPTLHVATATHALGLAAPTEGVAAASASWSTSTLALRSDAPVVRNTRRGDATLAISFLTALGAGPFVQEPIDDRIARSAFVAIGSWHITWDRFHNVAFALQQPPVPVLPVTTLSLVTVAALFEEGGYRSSPNYLATIKSAHIEAGHERCQLLHHTAAWCTRSVLRGIGPSRQSCAFDFGKIIT